jgi:uncharacterized protein
MKGKALVVSHARCPYYVFKADGFHLAIDRHIPAYFEIDQLAYEALDLLKEGAAQQVVESHLKEKWGRDLVTAVFASLAALKNKGFFVGRGAPPQMGATEDVENLVCSRTGKIQLALAESCNLRCRYCYVHRDDKWRSGRERIMPWEVARKGVDFLLRRAGHIDDLSITFFGGEPLLNKDVFHKVVSYTEQRKRELRKGKPTFYSLTTNGILMSRDVIRQIKRYNFGLMLSMDGPPEVHDAVRVFINNKGSWAATARGARELMKYRRQVSVRCTLTKRCLEKARIVRFLEDFGFYRIRMSVALGQAYLKGPYDIGPDELEALEADDKKIEEGYIEAIRTGDWDNHRFARYEQALMDVFEPQRQSFRCGVGRGTTIVDVKGDLYPCHRYLGMEKYQLGDVDEGVDPDLFAAYLEKFFALRRRLCSDCWANTLCSGPCPYYVSHPNGEMVEPEPWYCKMIRDGIEKNAVFHSRIRRDFPEYYQHVVEKHLAWKKATGRHPKSDREIADENDERRNQDAGPLGN